MTSDPSGESSLPSRRTFPWAATIFAFVLGLGMLLWLRTHGKVIRNDWYPYFVSILVPGVMALMLWARSERPCTVVARRYVPLLVVAFFTLALLFSSTVFHKWFFFLQWAPGHASPGKTGMSRFVCWTALLTPLFLFRFKRTWLVPLVILIGSEFLCAALLMMETGGQALYRTDHPSFMFRLWEFTRNFPDLVTYMPYWNAGVEHFVSVTSGTSGPGLILWPLLRFFPVHEVYTLAWALLFLLIVPWSAVGAVRAMGADRTSAFTAGILALGVSQHYFLWGLHYGTIGAAFASAMALPVSTLPFRVVWLGRREKWLAAALVLSSFLLLLWPPGGIAGAGVALALLLNAARLDKRKLVFLLLCGVVLVVLWSPWMRVILGAGRGVVDFVMTEGGGGGGGGGDGRGVTLNWTLMVSGFDHLKAHVQEINPLIIMFGFLGACVAGGRGVRRWFIPIFLVLAVVTGWAREFLPHSQLSRMSIPLAFVAVAPASLLVGRLLRVTDMRFAVVRAALTALLICTGYNVAKICANKGLARYVVMNEEVESLVDWIRANTPKDGRILFAGKCVHAYGAGNVAYLPVLTGREMMAVDYYGFPPEMVVYEYPPRRFRSSDEMTQIFLNAYNVSHVVTYHENWKSYFRARPDDFEEKITWGRITMFARAAHPGMFVKGSGSVKAAFDRIDVTLTGDDEEVVVAYNWLDGLKCEPPVEISPHEIITGITLIGIRPHGQKQFTIKFRR